MRGLLDNLADPLPRLFIQFLVILAAARACGALARKAGQPAVIGEMAAGILLGPSFLGWIWPAATGFVFPPGSLATLSLLSQTGVCLFMFIVGMELTPGHLEDHARTALVVSQTGIVVPFAIGLFVATLLYPTFAAPGAAFLPFALFIGISLSITAFPVLARILDERRLTRTRLGGLALACAAAGDVSAWCVLALVVAVVKSGAAGPAAVTVLLALVFASFMWWVVRPLTPRWFGEHVPAQDAAAGGLVARSIMLLLAAALATQLIGIHSLFGAFLAGVVMPPRGEVRDYLKIRLEHFTSGFLLPLFFASVGLRAHINALDSPYLWLVWAGITLAATLGKIGSTMLSGRWAGLSSGDAFSLGALMNTRGLVELVALNIGYDLGILPARIFTILVLMALFTTALTVPLLELQLRRRAAGGRPGPPSDGGLAA